MMDQNRIRLYTIVILLYAAITLIITYPLILNIETNLISGDPSLNTWILAWDVHSILTDPMHLFDANAFYPFVDNSLAFSEHLLANIFIALPIIVATDNPVLSYNVIFILSFILSGFGMFLLTDHYLNDKYSAFLAGIIFAFCTYRFAHLGHLQLLTAQWMPLSVLYLDKFLHKTTYTNLFLLILFFVLQVLSSWYYAFYITIALGLYFVYLSIFDQSIRNKILHDSDFHLKSVIFIVLCMIIILPFTLPYIQLQYEYGFTRSIVELDVNSADVMDYFLTSPHNVLYGKLSQPYQENRNWGEHSLFPGFLVVVLSLTGLSRLSKRSSSGPSSIKFYTGGRIQNFYVILALCAFVLSLGPKLHFFGKIIDLHLPYYYFYKYLPGFDSMRVPSRINIVVMLSLSVLAGYGLHKLLNDKSSTLKIFITLLFTIVIIFESYVPFVVAVTPVGDDIPDVYKWLSNESGDFAIVELPTGNINANSLYYDTIYMYYSTYHWKKIVNGYSGFFPPKYFMLLEKLQMFPSNESINILKNLKVKYIIIHSENLDQHRWNDMKDEINDNYKDLTLIKIFGQDYVYKVNFNTSEPDIKNIDLVAVSIPNIVQKGKNYRSSAIFFNYGNADYISEPYENIEISIKFSSNQSTYDLGPLTSMLPLILASQSSTYVSFNVEMPKTTGMYDLFITISDESQNITRYFKYAIQVVDYLDDSISSNSVHAEYLDYDIPSTVSTGSKFRVSVNALNDGHVLWQSKVSTSRPNGTVYLGSRWLQDDNELWISERSSLPSDISPGQNATVEMIISAPPYPGHYVLELDLVNEGITWFGWQSVKTIQQKITVQV